MDKKLLISFSGAQSTGKTTLLKKLKEHNAHVKFVPEVTRLIKREYGVEINEAGSTILDRCLLDGVVYTNYLDNQNNLEGWCLHQALYVFEKYVDQYDVIFYTDPADVDLEDDGERSVDVSFRNEIIHTFDRLIQNTPRFNNNNLVVLSGTVDERLQTIKSTLSEKGLEINIE
jgi:nicotinamide riboside kinase